MDTVSIRNLDGSRAVPAGVFLHRIEDDEFIGVWVNDGWGGESWDTFRAYMATEAVRDNGRTPGRDVLPDGRMFEDRGILDVGKTKDTGRLVAARFRHDTTWSPVEGPYAGHQLPFIELIVLPVLDTRKFCTTEATLTDQYGSRGFIPLGVLSNWELVEFVPEYGVDGNGRARLLDRIFGYIWKDLKTMEDY